MHLQQGAMTVAKYASQFTLLSGYAQHVVASEQMRAEQFQEDLRLNIRAQWLLSCFAPTVRWWHEP